MIPNRRSKAKILAFSTLFQNERCLHQNSVPSDRGRTLLSEDKVGVVGKKLQQRLIPIQEDLLRRIQKQNKANFRDHIFLHLVNIQIGGQGVVVEIDQLKLWKKKHHMWHPTTVSNQFLHKTANSLISFITTHVLEWSIIITDCFRSYRNIDSAYNHFTSKEGTRNALKYMISQRNRANALDENGYINEPVLDDFFAQFQSRRKNRKTIRGFMYAFRQVEYLN
ncbi:hypothetical protein RF11_13877 [Thelohanellus kitauei]|uniref:ISXO2-like transposase domain-containing protein n=1 Tax=Thelohanellus kitauei TaxID=669202 RepID=A0A0C2MJB6_THEKT|nr:hypothetical protein RF11_13877 [Thelohanellus kitauei]